MVASNCITRASSPIAGAIARRVAGNCGESAATKRGMSSLACLPTPNSKGQIVMRVSAGWWASRSQTAVSSVGVHQSKYAQAAAAEGWACCTKAKRCSLLRRQTGSLDPCDNKINPLVVGCMAMGIEDGAAALLASCIAGRAEPLVIIAFPYKRADNGYRWAACSKMCGLWPRPP